MSWVRRSRPSAGRRCPDGSGRGDVRGWSRPVLTGSPELVQGSRSLARSDADHRHLFSVIDVRPSLAWGLTWAARVSGVAAPPHTRCRRSCRHQTSQIFGSGLRSQDPGSAMARASAGMLCRKLFRRRPGVGPDRVRVIHLGTAVVRPYSTKRRAQQNNVTLTFDLSLRDRPHLPLGSWWILAICSPSRASLGSFLAAGA